MMHLKTPEEIELIALGGKIISDLLSEIPSRIQPGVSTLDLDTFSDEFIRSHAGAVPAFKGLYGFAGSVCASVNEEVVHGIPDANRTLAEGDIISIDVGVKLEGWCSDSAWTFAVGEIDEESRRLMTVTEEALDAAVAVTLIGNHVGDIGAAVMARVDGTGMSIIKDLVGHGVGRDVHEEPQVPNLGTAGSGPLLREGLVLAIEPMLSLGSPLIRTLDDRWTVVTQDGTRTAHFEHTVAITSGGARILTGARAEAPA
jgi:methionyl aminopeptidase